MYDVPIGPKTDARGCSLFETPQEASAGTSILALDGMQMKSTQLSIEDKAISVTFLDNANPSPS